MAVRQVFTPFRDDKYMKQFSLNTLFASFSFVNILAAFLLLCSFQPFFVWTNGLLYSLANFLLVLVLISSLKIDKNNILYILVLFLLFSWVNIRGGYTIIGALANYCLLIIVCLKEKRYIQVYDCFTTLFTVVICISLILYILVVIAGVNLPSYELEPLNKSKHDVVYHCYLFLVTYESYGLILPRFCGIFDEPGVVGTICGCLLVANRFNMKDIRNVIIFLAGVFSLSLFFFVVFFIYVFLFSNFKVKISAVFIAVILLFFFSNNEFIDYYLLDRFEFSGGKMAGDSRKLGLSQSWYKSFQSSSSYYWGLGNDAHSRYNAGGSSYSDLIIDYGVVFLLIYIVSGMFYAFKRLKHLKLWLAFLLVFGGVIYQRPFITIMGYFFLMLAPIYTLDRRKEIVINDELNRQR